MEWKPECNFLLLQEIIVSEPYQYKVSTRERGKIWEDITERLNSYEAFAHRLGQKRAVRDRYALLSRKYKKKMTEEERASGISPEMSEIDKLLEQIIERFEESDKETGDKGKQAERSKTEDGKKAEEMRKLSMEKLGETLKRKGEEDGGATPRKRASGSETIVYLREKAERDFDLRKEELETRKRDQTQQLQMFQYMQQQLQQQQQQQQQMQLQHQQQQLQNQLLMTLIEKLNKN